MVAWRVEGVCDKEELLFSGIMAWHGMVWYGMVWHGADVSLFVFDGTFFHQKFPTNHHSPAEPRLKGMRLLVNRQKRSI